MPEGALAEGGGYVSVLEGDFVASTYVSLRWRPTATLSACVWFVLKEALTGSWGMSRSGGEGGGAEGRLLSYSAPWGKSV
jgi:hypothetical protein